MQSNDEPQSALLRNNPGASGDSARVGDPDGALEKLVAYARSMSRQQCPEGVKKKHGNHHCLPCKIGSRPDAEAVRVGAWRLAHLPSEKGCICILSTIDADDDLAKILESLQIEF